jgi:hypothetical protein
MAQDNNGPKTKRPWGTGSIIPYKHGFEIRCPEYVIGKDGVRLNPPRATRTLMGFSGFAVTGDYCHFLQRVL